MSAKILNFVPKSRPDGPEKVGPHSGANGRSWRMAAVERSPKMAPVVSAVRGIVTIRDRVIFGNSCAQG
jgi:hypothetical protein